MAGVTLVPYNDARTGVSLNYPSDMAVEPLSSQDTQDNFILRLSQAGELPALITLRYETGLRKATSLSRQSPLDLVVSNIKQSFPRRYSDYKLLEEHTFEKNDHKFGEVNFTYRGPAGETAHQRLIVLIKDDDTAIYLTAQAREADFAKADSTYFRSILDSIQVK